MAFVGTRRALLKGVGVPGWVLAGATVDLNFASSLYYGGALAALVACTRAGSATDLRPASASGASYATYGANVLRINGNGLLVEQSTTNQLLNSTAPATQTTGSLGAGTYTLWVNGSGTAAVAGGTAIITGAGTASQGSPLTFVVTSPGTVVVTVVGSLNAFQLESGSFGTSLIVTAGATASRSADVVTLTGLANTIIQSDAFSLVAALGGSPNTNPHLLRDASASYDLKFNGTPSQVGIAAVCNSRTLSGNLGSGNIGSAVKFGFSIDGVSGGSLVGNNGTVITDATARWAGTSPNGLMFGYDGYLQRLTLWNSKIGDSVLKNFTL